jgi:hypothetical protein
LLNKLQTDQKSAKSLDNAIAILKQHDESFDGNIASAVMKISYKQSHVLDSLAKVLNLSWKDYLDKGKTIHDKCSIARFKSQRVLPWWSHGASP